MLQALVSGSSLMLNSNHIPEAALFVSQKPAHCTSATSEDLINNHQLCKHDPSPVSVMLQGTNKRWTLSSSSSLQQPLILNLGRERRLSVTDDTWKRKLLFGEWRWGTGGMLMESSLQCCTEINTGRTLGVLAVTTNSWSKPPLPPAHRPKEHL